MAWGSLGFLLLGTRRDLRRDGVTPRGQGEAHDCEWSPEAKEIQNQSEVVAAFSLRDHGQDKGAGYIPGVGFEAVALSEGDALQDQLQDGCWEGRYRVSFVQGGCPG